jgi:hypothetical protein
MPTAHIYSALCLSHVIQQLRAFRLSGLLTFRRAAGKRSDEASIFIERGQPQRIRWGKYEGIADESILQLCDAWGEIHFVFLAREEQLQLPSPSQPARLSHPPVPSRPRSLSPVTQPLLARHQLLSPHPHPDADRLVETGTSRAEVTVPFLTVKAKDCPLTNLPRYDRTIFLLINGSRSIADLAHLTKRSLPAVYGSLSRLRDQQLIVGF